MIGSWNVVLFLLLSLPTLTNQFKDYFAQQVSSNGYGRTLNQFITFNIDQVKVGSLKSMCPGNKLDGDKSGAVTQNPLEIWENYPMDSCTQTVCSSTCIINKFWLGSCKNDTKQCHCYGFDIHHPGNNPFLQHTKDIPLIGCTKTVCSYSCLWYNYWYGECSEKDKNSCHCFGDGTAPPAVDPPESIPEQIPLPIDVQYLHHQTEDDTEAKATEKTAGPSKTPSTTPTTKKSEEKVEETKIITPTTTTATPNSTTNRITTTKPTTKRTTTGTTTTVDPMKAMWKDIPVVGCKGRVGRSTCSYACDFLGFYNGKCREKTSTCHCKRAWRDPNIPHKFIIPKSILGTTKKGG